MTDYNDDVERTERNRPSRKQMGKNARYTRMFQRINKAAKHRVRQVTKRFIRQTQEEEE